MKNRLYNCMNPYQGISKRVLCVCSAGLLRSPTAAWVLSNEPFGFNTRAVGLDLGHALIPLDKVLLFWADDIVCMDKIQLAHIEELLEKDSITGKDVHSLNIPDSFAFKDPKLVDLITEKCKEIYGV